MQYFKSLFIPFLLLLTQSVWSSPIKILPLGDSITHGDGWNLPYSSYRDELYDLLTNEGYDFEFVGTQSSNFNGITLKHEGVPSIRVDEILNGGAVNGNISLQTKLTNFEVDIVLLHAGTNDILQSQGSDTTTLADIENVINELQVKNPNVIVLVAKIIPIRDPDESLGLNSLLTEDDWAQTQSTNNSSVIIVDQNSDITSNDLNTDLIHPKQSGETKMANKWFDALDQLLSGANLTLVAPSSVFVGTSFTIAHTSNSTGSITYSSTTQSICTVSSNTVSTINSGTCSILGEQDAEGDYESDTNTLDIVVSPKLNQTVSLTTSVSSAFVGNTFTISATSTSGLTTFIYSSNTPNICSLNNNIVTALTDGDCKLTAYQEGNSTYNSATSQIEIVKIIKQTQTVILNTPVSSFTAGEVFILNARSSSGLIDFEYSTTTPSICSLIGNTVSGVSEGDCKLMATQPGNTNYYAANSIIEAVTIIKSNQTVTLNTPSTVKLGNSFSVNATASSSLDVEIISETPEICTITDNKATPLVEGICKITAKQLGNKAYNPQSTVKSVIITETAESGGSITPLSLFLLIMLKLYTRKRLSKSQ